MEHAISPTLAGLIPAAQRAGMVLSQPLTDGRTLMVYPVQPGEQVLVGVGYDPQQAHRIDGATLLRRRSADMARYGSWLPARFEDGSWYVLRRWSPDAERLGQDWSDAALQAAQELLHE